MYGNIISILFISFILLLQKSRKQKKLIKKLIKKLCENRINNGIYTVQLRMYICLLLIMEMINRTNKQTKHTYFVFFAHYFFFFFSHKFIRIKG